MRKEATSGMNIRPLFKLDSRLQLCASMVRENGKLADVGTDHAYLPIWLAKQGRISKAIAADINLGPLKKAAFNVRRYHVEETVSTRLSNGLDEIFPHEADDIVLAGMGGELISNIIERAPWLKNKEKHLILQPMTSAEELRRFLQKEGYAVSKEQAVRSDGRVYAVILASYDPQNLPKNELYPYIGLLTADTEESREYIARQAKSIEKHANGLQMSGQEEESVKYFHVLEELQKLLSDKTGE
jgi:tRNA (adenine22-N1)-methyltransferase